MNVVRRSASRRVRNEGKRSRQREGWGGRYITEQLTLPVVVVRVVACRDPCSLAFSYKGEIVTTGLSAEPERPAQSAGIFQGFDDVTATADILTSDRKLPAKAGVTHPLNERA